MSSRIPFYALIQTHPSEHHSADEQGNDPTMLHPQPSPSLSEDSPQRRFRYLSELTVSEERSSEKCTHSADGEPTQAHYPLPTGPPPPYHPSQIPHPAPQPSSTTLPTSHASTSLAPSFSRQPSSSVPYPPFPLMCLTAKGKHLDKGFPVVPPSTTITPHPFATHDVNEDDWHRFLDDLKKAGKLTGREQIAASAVPITTRLPIIGVLASSAIESSMEKRKAIPVGELITTWNHLFFHPRRMEVVLAKGQLSSMGHKNSIPDLPKRQSNCSSSSCSSLSSSSSSASSSSDGHWDGQGKGEREVYKADRKARKAERKIHRAERKKYNKEKEVHRKQERQQRKAERKHAKIEAKNDKKYKLLVLALYPGSEAACPGEHMYSQ